MSKGFTSDIRRTEESLLCCGKTAPREAGGCAKKNQLGNTEQPSQSAEVTKWNVALTVISLNISELVD
jgi:hypothetical protein